MNKKGIIIIAIVTLLLFICIFLWFSIDLDNYFYMCKYNGRIKGEYLTLYISKSGDVNIVAPLVGGLGGCFLVREENDIIIVPISDNNLNIFDKSTWRYYYSFKLLDDCIQFDLSKSSNLLYTLNDGDILRENYIYRLKRSICKSDWLRE